MDQLLTHVVSPDFTGATAISMHELQALEEFCFPTGVPADSKDSTPSGSNSRSSALVHHQKNPQNSFMFILTSDIKEIFYAICVVDDSLKNWPTFVPLQGDASQVKSTYNRSRCYMLISRWPFFNFFFDVIYSMLGAEEANQSFQNDLSEQVQQNMVIRIVETLMNTPVPGPGETLSLPFANIAPFIRPKADVDEEEELFTELCVPLLFYALELDQILQIMSAVLLEKKILFISSNVRLVTGCLCAFIPLVRPYILQCVLIPIVPDRLTQILQAPVPFIVGMANVPWARAEAPQLARSEIVMVDLDAKKIHMPLGMKLPQLPGVKAIQKALESPYKELTKTFHSSAPYRATPDQKARAVDLVHLLEEHFFAPMFKRFKHHCVTNLTDNVTVFLKESYLAEETTVETQDFFEQFLETQIFQIFSDKRLREIDNYLPRQRTSSNVVHGGKDVSSLTDDPELPAKLKEAIEQDDEAKRGDIAWDPSSLLKAEDLAFEDEPKKTANGSPTLPTPRSGSRGAVTPRLLADRGRSASSTGFLTKTSKDEAVDTPFSPVRKPIIPAAARSNSESSKTPPPVIAIKFAEAGAPASASPK
eukprot:TRINITY_DN585_c0_g4_i1.p1 TRINITY_DN585_c0_g4~~TRINITY_DN585_c0_g4_i1.p1  ORF type:complete len:591 (-),score=98.07 TRINITY_DN585_c0_g4_i1:34-1806(-)